MPPREETLEDLYREVGLRPAALDPRNTARREAPRPLPRSMRPPEERMRDTRLGQAERLRAAGQATFGPDITLDGPNFGDQGRMDYVRQLRRDPGGAAVGALGDVTGARPLATGLGQLAAGDVRGGIINTGLGALTLGTLGAGRPALRGAAPVRAAIAEAPTPPPTLSPTWERAGDGSVLPVRPQSDRLFSRTAPTSADLRGATMPRPLYRGLGSPDRRSPWATSNRMAASDYATDSGGAIRDPNARAPFVEFVNQKYTNPLRVTTITDLRHALGDDADRLLQDYDIDLPWEPLDDVAVQGALRQRGYDAVLLRDVSPNGIAHDSTLFLNEATATPPAFGGQVPLSPIDVFHGTPRRGKDSFFPWSHHGTQRAARDRLRETGTRGLFRRRGDILQTQIAPGRVIDLPDDAEGRSVFVSPHATIAEIARLGHFTQEEMEYIWEPLIVARANREPGVALTFEGYSATDAMEQRAAEVLQRKGIVAFRYRNEHEDPGSYSYVVPDPRNARVGRGEWPSGPEAPPAITAPQAQPPISPSLGDMPAPRPRGNAPDPGGVFGPTVWHGSAAHLGRIRPRLFTTNDTETASFFAKLDRNRTGGARRLTPLELNLTNPLEIDGKGYLITHATMRNGRLPQILDEAEAGGHDAVVFRNVTDGPGAATRDQTPIDVTVVLNPRSATKGRPTYLDDPSIVDRIRDVFVSRPSLAPPQPGRLNIGANQAFANTAERPRGNAPDPGGVFANASGRPIRAYHGSPHDFDRFDASRIGTGEGAQAYGHGLYFAENEGVARSYRDALASTKPQDMISSYIEYAVRYGREKGEGATSAGYLRAQGLPADRETAQLLDRAISGARYGKDGSVYYSNDGLNALRRLEPRISVPGRMYEVNIHADPEEFLDWDAPLAGQPALEAATQDSGIVSAPFPYEGGIVATRDRTLFPGPLTGERAYRAMERQLGFNQAPTRLADAGIPGIRYLDQGSRYKFTVRHNGGESQFNDEAAAQAFARNVGGTVERGGGTRNYVIFPGREEIIEILRKYGIGGVTLGGLGAGAQQNAPGS